MDKILLEHIEKERKFLHDLSNQLVIAEGMLSIANDNLQAAIGTEDKNVIRLQKAAKAIEVMITIITARRNLIKGEIADDAE